MEPKFVSIEGNIGSGKSTLLTKLRDAHADHAHWYYVDEPVSRWMETKQGDKSLLEIFYEDRPRWSYTFQSFALLTRLQAINATYQRAMQDIRDGKVTERPIILMERSLETDSNIFAKMLHDTGDILDIEWTIYNEWNKEFNKLNSVAKRAIIWVDTPVGVCVDRIHGRGRQGEDKIGKDYLDSLDVYHHQWLDNEKKIDVFKVINWGDLSKQTTFNDILHFIY
jgi:deoxyadenosine/deoxycytidine kinase